MLFTEKKEFFFLFFSVKGKNLTLFPSQFSLILLGSARLVGKILGVNINFAPRKWFVMSF